MLDSVVRARNKWLKPTGTLFPSHATMYFSMVSFEEDREQKITGKQSHFLSLCIYLRVPLSLRIVDRVCKQYV